MEDGDPQAAAAAMQQALQQAHQHIQLLQQQIQQLQQQQQQQQQQAPAPNVNLKPPRPSLFSGSSKDKDLLEDWLFALDTYFGALAAPPNDQQRIAFVASHLSGTARKWWRLNAPQHVHAGATFLQFTAALRTAFAAHNAQQKARDRIDTLRQATSVSTYNTKFRELMLEIPNMTPAELLHRYVAGLKPVTKQHLLIHDPQNLDDAMNMADRVDTAAYEARQANNTNSNNRRRPVRWNRPFRPDTSGPTPMELGALATPRRKLTFTERQYLINNNGCFYCRKLGHTATQCRLRPKTDQQSFNNNRARPLEQQPKNGWKRSN
jgi:hypothetical protein